MLFDLHFCYEGEDIVRPYVVNCDLCLVAHYVEKVSFLACVSQVFINIHPATSYCDFFEFTI